MEKMVLSFFGVYPTKETKRLTWKKIRRTLSLLSFFIHVSQILHNCFYQSFDESAFSVVWVTEIGFSFKLITFIYYGKIVLQFEDILNRNMFKNISKTHYTSPQQRINFAKWFTRTNIYLVLLYVIFIAYYAPLKMSGKERHLPSEARVPCSLDNDVCYIGFFIFHSVNCIMTATTNTVLDCLFCKFTTICSGLFEVVQKNFEELDYRNYDSSLKTLRKNIILHHKVLK